jgi:hypothetical protein
MMTGGFENSGVKIFSPGNNGNQFADIAQPLRRHESWAARPQTVAYMHQHWCSVFRVRRGALHLPLRRSEPCRMAEKRT